MRNLLLVLATICVPSTVAALSRDQAIENATGYVYVAYNVTSANVYPAADCYLGPGWPGSGSNSALRLGEHLPIGSYTGEVYGFGLDQHYVNFGSQIAAGWGAGDYNKLWNSLGGALQSCLLAHTTGIDCSAFVCRAWAIPRIGTATLGDGSISRATTRTALTYADAMLTAGHVRLVHSGVDGAGLYVAWEAIGDDIVNRCAPSTYDYQDDVSTGYSPRVSVKLKDDPASEVVGFDAARVDQGVLVRWTTLQERDTQSFAIWRSTSPDGVYVKASSDITPLGGPGSGADYEFIDPDGGPAYFYRLTETEGTGRELGHGTRSVQESLEWSHRAQ